MEKLPRFKKGFTLIELLVVIAIIGLIVAVVSVAINGAQSRGRDSKVRSDKQLIVLALVRAREADPNYQYPGVGGASSAYCLKASGTCWNGAYSGNSTIATAISPYLTNGVIPKPPGTKSGEHRYDSYLYMPGPTSVNTVNGPKVGAWLVWPQEKPIPDCNSGGDDGGTTDPGTGIYYCYEMLPK